MDIDYAYGLPPYDDNYPDICDAIVEQITEQVLGDFRNMLVERIYEDLNHVMDNDYIPPLGWEDVYDDCKESIHEAVYKDVEWELVHKLDDK